MTLGENKILFITPFFFSYHEHIKFALEKVGYKVDMINKDAFTKQTLEAILKSNQINNYEYVLCLGGGLIDSIYLKGIKEKLINAFFVFYNWDDVKSYPDVQQKYTLFDKCYTYSLYESGRNTQLIYQPFFFINNLELKKIYDVAFIGTAHSDRISTLREFKAQNKNLNLFIHLYKPLAYYLIKPLYLKAFKDDLLTTKSLSYDKTIRVFSQSKALLELPIAYQQSPTTRSIESLGTRTKVITSCSEIKNYNYYNENNFFIIDRQNMKIDNDWLEVPYKNIDSELLNQYTIDYWIMKILDKSYR